MSDDTTLDPGAGGDAIRTKDRTGIKTQIVALDLNPAGAETLMAGAIPVTGPVTDVQLRAVPVPVSGTVTVQDGGGSITTDNATTSVVGGGVEAAAQRVTIASDSTGVLSVDDNGGSLTVDGTVAVSGTVAVTDNAGSLTVDNPVLSVVGGGVEATAVRVTVASDSTGVLSVDDNGGNLSIDDGGNSITVDNTVISVVGTGTEAAAQRVTIATDSTGVLSVDDNGGSLTVDGTVTANAGTGPFPVSDNAGSLTVDAPVATPVFVRLSDGAAAITALPITDNAGSLTVDGTITANLAAGVNNIGDVDVLTLPALIAGAAEIGKVQISDGTDVATVLPVRSVPATTEKVLVTSELPTRLPTYQAVTAEVAPAITIGVKELLTFFHPAAVTQDVYIVEITVSILVTTASTTGGRTNIEVLKATSAGTGGTNLAAADVGGGLGTSAVITNSAANVMQVKTGGGALGTALIRQGVEHATQPLGAQRFEVFKASSVGNGIIMRGGSADGINIQVNRVVAHTALVDQWTASIRWIEL